MNKKPTTAVQVRELAKQMRVCAERFEQAAKAMEESSVDCVMAEGLAGVDTFFVRAYGYLRNIWSSLKVPESFVSETINKYSTTSAKSASEKADETNSKASKSTSKAKKKHSNQIAR